MTYNLSDQFDKGKFLCRCQALAAKGAVVELCEKRQRTLNQNSYLHIVLGVVAMETGNGLEFVKQEYFKRLVNPSLFVSVREDKYCGKVSVLRSSADLTTEEMSLAIDRFKRWASENGIYVPDADEEDLLKAAEIQMGRMRQWI